MFLQFLLFLVFLYFYLVLLIKFQFYIVLVVGKGILDVYVELVLLDDVLVLAGQWVQILDDSLLDLQVDF